MSYALHPSAETELIRIVEFISKDSLLAASRVLEEFRNTFALLAKNPRIGHRRRELTTKPLCFWTLRRFVIAYDPETEPLLVFMIIDGMRSPVTISRILAERDIGSRADE